MYNYSFMDHLIISLITSNFMRSSEDDRLKDAAYLRGTLNVSNEIHFKSAAGLSSPDVYHDLQHKLDDKPVKPRLHMMSDVDEVVFGHDVDFSGSYEHIRNQIPSIPGIAGKSSKAVVEGKHWTRRDVARADRASVGVASCSASTSASLGRSRTRWPGASRGACGACRATGRPASTAASSATARRTGPSESSKQAVDIYVEHPQWIT